MPEESMNFQNPLKDPLLIVYGTPSSFAERLDGFRHAVKDANKGLYLEIDAQSAKQDTWPATLLDLLHQIGEAVLHTIPATEESTQLQVYKRLHLLQNLQRQIRDDAPQEQLVQCMDFAELVFYPMLTTIWQSAPSVILGLMHVEEILSWGGTLCNFLVESLLRHFPHGLLRIVLFVQHPEEPHVFSGSNEIYAKKKIELYCLTEET